MEQGLTRDNLHDIIVVGGGISGLGVALEASRAGFETVLLERHKICQATSNNSLRIVHGGFRYLQSLDFPRVVESIRDQALALKEAPNLIKKLPCLMPLRRSGLKSSIPVQGAAYLYNWITHLATGASNGAAVVSSSWVDDALSALPGLAPHGALLWHDAQIRDQEKFASLLLHKIDKEGGSIYEDSPVSAIRRDGDRFIVSGTSEGEHFSLRTRAVINTTGPWIDTIGRSTPLPSRCSPKKWCRAFNVVLSKTIEPRYALGVEGEENRLFFLVPRAEGSVLGTGYLPLKSDVDDPAIGEEEVLNFVTAFAKLLPEGMVSGADIVRIESGVLPAQHISNDSVKLYGYTRICRSEGIVDVLSTKYTTYRSQARRALREAAPCLRH